MGKTNGYLNGPCRRRLTTRESELTNDDFVVSAVATEDDPGEFDVVVTLSAKELFSDIEGFVTAGNANIYSDDAPETSIGTDAGPNTTGQPTNLQFTFQDVPQTVGNTGNTWTLVVANVQVNGKDGDSSFTLPVVRKTFPSPL